MARDINSSQIYLNQAAILVECIDSSGRNVQEHIFKVKMKVDPGAERKSSGNFFCLLALLSYLLASFSGRLRLKMALIWY